MSDANPRLFLNHATAAELGRVPGIEPGDAETLATGGPYRGWDDIQRAGVSAQTVKALQRADIGFGEPSSGPIGEPGSGGHGGAPAGNLGRA